MDCTEAYKEHIMYSFNGFCKVVIRYAAINAWRDRNRRRQREISFEYLTEEKFYPLSTSDEYLKSPYEQYPVTICGAELSSVHAELKAVESTLREKKDLQKHLLAYIKTKPARDGLKAQRTSESESPPLKTGISTGIPRTA